MTPLTEFMAPAPRTDDVPSRSATGGRDPAHELYEHAAGLLTTAQALEAATREPGAVAAVGPTLACWEASLVALASATERLRRHALERLTEPVLATENLRARRADAGAAYWSGWPECLSRARSRARRHVTRSSRCWPS